jgi:hypothetical protein
LIISAAATTVVLVGVGSTSRRRIALL